MTERRLIAEPRVAGDVAAAFEWYEREQAGLRRRFLVELAAAYDRITVGPLGYQESRSGIRRPLVRRFPYAVYFVVDDAVVIVAVLHARRGPAEWQRRGP